MQKNINCNLIDRRKLLIGGQIGSGSFGAISLGNFLLEDKTYKKCATKELNEDGGNSKELMNEIIRMSDFKHVNIIEFYGYSLEEEKFTKGKRLIMVMEYCENGSLDKRLKKDPMLSPQKMLDFSIQIANGMCYLANKSFVHRDLAARNILLANNERTVKIGDFGLSRFLNEEKYYSAKENTKCPILWMPPEFWEDQKEFGKAKRFSTKSDVWGFGVTMWEMFSHGKRPWEGREHEVMDLVLNGEILEMPQDCPLKIWEVIKWCWTYDYQDRPNFEILKFELDQIEKEFETTVVPVNGFLQAINPDIEENNLLDKDINNDSKRLLKQSMAVHDKDPVYRCLCGVRVRNASLIWSIISLLFSGIIIYLIIEKLFETRNQGLPIGVLFPIVVLFLPSFYALTTVFILCGEKFRLPKLYLPYLFINVV